MGERLRASLDHVPVALFRSDLSRQVQQLTEQMDQVQRQLGELAERVDFAERLLTQQRERDRLPKGS